MSFDLSTRALVSEFEVKLTEPDTGVYITTDEGEFVSITIYGTASKQYRAATAALKLKNSRKAKLTPDDERKATIEMLASLSKSSKNLVVDGAEIKTEEDFAKLYGDDRFAWVVTQVTEALTDQTNFLKKA